MQQEAPNPRHIYSWITQQIAAAIAAGAPRFEMPWHQSQSAMALPANVASGRPYRGINVLSLWVAGQVRGYGTAEWGTYRQWTQLRAQVRKGERGSMIVFYKKPEAKEKLADQEEEAPAPRLIARASWVFNADQVDNWLLPEAAEEIDLTATIESADHFIASCRAEIHEGGDIACYHPHADYIQMPPRRLFLGTSTSSPTESYYATLLHELTHWTGHSSRLSRDFSQKYGDEAYAVEELVAELGAAFLCAELGLTNSPRPDHAAYVQSWLRVLGNDSHAIFSAASKAQAAVEYLAVHQDASA
jgi:antirestriction protein ArdC